MKHVDDRPGHDIAYKMKNTKITFERTPFESGIKETVEWYRSNEWWWKPLINDSYFTKDEEWKISSE
jgi:dTDP-glucose 4,6-dehydratase